MTIEETHAELLQLRELLASAITRIGVLESQLAAVVHLKSRKDPATSETLERFEGSFVFGGANTGVGTTQDNTVVEFSKDSEILLHFTPSVARHPTSKEYVDGLFNNLAQQILKLK